MISIQSTVVKFIAKYYVRPGYYPDLDVNRLRKTDVKSPSATLVRGCTREMKTINGVDCTILTPSNQTSNRILIYIHGGGYVSGPNKMHWKMLANICRKTGNKAILVNYGLAPESSCLNSIEDVISVYNNLISEINASEIYFLGDSAGGGLSLATILKLKEDRKPLPAALILLSPFLDMTLSNPEIENIEPYDTVLYKKGLQDVGKIYAGDFDLSHPFLSPINGNLEGLPPTLLLIGTHDIFLSDCRKFRDKAKKSGIRLTYKEWDKMFHLWMLVVSLVPEANKAVKTIVNFITATIESPKVTSHIR
ncbi:MAG TPA: alpha/beta hydrolase [Victivallales bacterium]|nr:alpha/beta hydrolase [Victivallales bacterium]